MKNPNCQHLIKCPLCQICVTMRLIKAFIKTLRWILIILAVLMVIGFIYEQFSRYYYNSKRPNKSEFVEVDGRKIHFHKEGQGGSTVVFESGLGGDHLHWKEIQKELSKDFTTLSYDKAGILWSDYSDEISLQRYSSDLHQLLERTNCPKPYILVGHSFAGITLRSFIQDSSEDIEGVIFVDVSHPQQLLKASEKLKASVRAPSPRVMNFLNSVGLVRLLFTVQPFITVVPKNHWFNANIKNYFHRILPGLNQELVHDDALMAEAIKVSSIGNIPLTIITATYPSGVEGMNDRELQEEYLSLHQTLQQDLLNLSANSKQVFATESGHYVTFQQPELIVQEVRKIKGVNPILMR